MLTPIAIVFSRYILQMGEVKLSSKNGKVTLPDELQKEMFNFFLETSIPRKKKELESVCPLSENQKTDRSDENVNKCEKNEEDRNTDT